MSAASAAGASAGAAFATAAGATASRPLAFATAARATASHTLAFATAAGATASLTLAFATAAGTTASLTALRARRRRDVRLQEARELRAIDRAVAVLIRALEVREALRTRRRVRRICDRADRDNH